MSPSSSGRREPVLITIVSFSKEKSSSESLDRRTRTLGLGLADGENADEGFDDASVSLALGGASGGVSESGGSVAEPFRSRSSVGVLRSSEGSGMGEVGESCIFEGGSAGRIDGVDEQG